MGGNKDVQRRVGKDRYKGSSTQQAEARVRREKRERDRRKEEKSERNSLFRCGAAGGMVGATEGDEREEEGGRS